MRLTERVAARAEIAAATKPEVSYSIKFGIVGVDSVNVAKCIAHEHFNVTNAARKVLGMRPTLAGEFHWDTYVASTGRELPCVFMTEKGLSAIFNHLHSVEGCADVRAVLAIYKHLFTSTTAGPGNPAPDHEIRPPDQEPANLFDIEQITDPAESWEINAAVLLLTTRTGLPRYLRNDLDGWNTDRCKALSARVKHWSHNDAIYATRPHSKGGK
jgi:hypothetical protein